MDKVFPSQEVVGLNPYDSYMPTWVKGFIGALAGIILIPSVAIIAVANLAGIKESLVNALDAYMKVQVEQLHGSKQIVQEIQALREQTATLNASIEERLNRLEETTTKHDSQIRSIEKTLSIRNRR